MLSVTSNMTYRDNILRAAAQELGRRLPDGWAARLERRGIAADDIGGFLRVTAPDGSSVRLAVVAKRRLEPRDLIDLHARGLGRKDEDTRLIVAPYLSPGVRERLRTASFTFLDLTGNARIELRRPGLFVETRGADVDPDRKARPPRTLRGPKAGRIVRALIDSKKSPGVRELAERTGVDAGYVSRILSLLDREALIERQAAPPVIQSQSGPKTASIHRSRSRSRGSRIARRKSGPIAHVDWPALLRRWAEAAPLQSRGAQATCLEPRGLGTFVSRLGGLTVRYAITGTLAAARYAAVAPPRLATVYVDNIERSIGEIPLRVAERGSNVLLIEPIDEGVFVGATIQDGRSYVAPSQAAADLLTSPGRGPAEADELIAWMNKHERGWRG